MYDRAWNMGDAESSLSLARDIADAVRAAGGRGLVVGGYVRDRLVGIDAKDLDIEVFGIPAERLQQVIAPFGHVQAVGQSFPVFKVATIDVSLPRRESKAGRGHKGFTVHGDPMLSFEEAARRRDFTMNAIGWDPLTDEYLDPFGGHADLQSRRLRVVDPRTFGDDSLRVLRAVQLAARFSLEVDAETRHLLGGIPLDDLPGERIWGEIEKLLLQASKPSTGFALALDIGVVDALLPELRPLVGCPQELEWHPEGDVWVHTLLVIDQAREGIDSLSRAERVSIMLGAVCHDLGKPPTTAILDGRIRSLGHEEAGVPIATSLLDRLNLHAIDGVDVRRDILGIVAHHLKPGAWHKSGAVGDGAFRRLAQKVNLELLTRVARADCMGRGGGFDCSAMDWFRNRARSLGVEQRPPAPILLGRHLLSLGMAPGPEMGRLLKQIYERQLDGEITSVEEGIAAAKQLMH